MAVQRGRDVWVRCNAMQNRHYPQKLRSQLREWQDKVDRLRQRLSHAGEESRRELENQIEDLHAKQKAAREKLAQMDRGGGSRTTINARVREACSRIGAAARRWLPGGR